MGFLLLVVIHVDSKQILFLSVPSPLNAPHMSFELTVTYMTRPFEQQYRAAVYADSASKNRDREASF